MQSKLPTPIEHFNTRGMEIDIDVEVWYLLKARCSEMYFFLMLPSLTHYNEFNTKNLNVRMYVPVIGKVPFLL